MDPAEALAFLGLEGDFDQADLQDALEEQLFELKRFFISRAPVQKLFQSRLDKLQKIRLAAGILAPELAFSVKGGKTPFSFETTDLLEAYRLYQQENRRLKTEITRSSDPLEIRVLAESLIALEKQYAAKWAVEDLGDEKAIVSKESDPMEILAAIKAFRELGGFTFEDLKKKENSAPETLLNEMKRLSLLFFKY